MVSASLAVTADAIKAFAREFDPQPFHIDEAAAEHTFFGRLAASGWHTAALTMRLNVEGGLPIAGGIIGAGGEITWPTPLVFRGAFNASDRGGRRSPSP